MITVGVTDENINAPNFDFYIGEDQVQNIPEGTLQEDDEDKSIVKLRIVLVHGFPDLDILKRVLYFGPNWTFFELEHCLFRKSPTESPDDETWERATDLDFTIPNTRTCFEIINSLGDQCSEENLELKASDYFSVIATKETIDSFLFNYLESSSDGSMV